MRTPARLAGFAAVLGVAFGAAALVGAAVEPLRDADDPHGRHAPALPGHGGGHAGGATPAAGPPQGLAVAEGGYRLVLDATVLPRGRTTELSFRVVGPDGAAVRDFAVEHARRMHLIVVRRDLSGFQHLHPAMTADGRWSARLRLPEAGVYRAYADFAAGGRSLTLAADIAVPGAFAPRELPAPAPVAGTGRYEVRLTAAGLAPGADAELAYDVARGGAPAGRIEPYLGADGHLVALREGDLAFLHVHPEESAAPGRIRFGAALPSAGRYRLFLQFRHDGRVRTVSHTVTVGP